MRAEVEADNFQRDKTADKQIDCCVRMCYIFFSLHGAINSHFHRLQHCLWLLFSFLASTDPITSTQHVHIGQPVTGFNPTGVQSASPETSKDIFYDFFYMVYLLCPFCLPEMSFSMLNEASSNNLLQVQLCRFKKLCTRLWFLYNQRQLFCYYYVL